MKWMEDKERQGFIVSYRICAASTLCFGAIHLLMGLEIPALTRLLTTPFLPLASLRSLWDWSQLHLYLAIGMAMSLYRWKYS